MKVDSVAPAPGSIPTRKPNTVPREIDGRLYLNSSQLSQMRSALMISARVPSRTSMAVTMTSVNANIPMATTTKSMPSWRKGLPKVYRGAPETRSMPTVAIIRPKQVVITDLTTLVPVRLATVDKPKTIRAKNSAGPK